MDQAEFERLLSRVPVRSPEAAPTAPAPGGDQAAQPPEAPPTQASAGRQSLSQDPNVREAAGQMAEGQGSVRGALEPPAVFQSFAGGVAKGFFEMKDFAFGDTDPEEQSSFRRVTEENDEAFKRESTLYGFSSGIGQFAGAMVGLGKLSTVAQGLPWFGAGLRGFTQAAPITAEVSKAAIAGAIAFDPYEERLSNLVQGTPLANPLTEWLAADPTDSRAEARAKAALESVALDGAIITTFMLGSKVWKALRMGNKEAASRYASQLQAAAQGGAEDAAVGGVRGASEAAAMGTEDLAGALGREGGEAVPPNAGPAATPDAPNAAPTSVTPTAPTAATSAAEDSTRTLTPSLKQPKVDFSIEDTEAVLKGMDDDTAAVVKHGGDWHMAVASGHAFGKGPGIPYQRMGGDIELNDFMARVVDASEEKLTRLKGGNAEGVLTDATVTRVANQWTSIYGEDPAGFLAAVQLAGSEARKLPSLVEAGLQVSRRMFQDAHALSLRINMGDFTGHGSKEAAVEEARKMMALASSVYGSTRSLVANSGRTVRRMQTQFAIDPKIVDGLRSLDNEQFLALMQSTGGDARKMAKLGRLTAGQKIVDYAGFLLVNNLVSGPKTHLINILGNSYMVGSRPLELIVGSTIQSALGGGAGRGIAKQAMRQYAYMGVAAMDGFSSAARAFVINDSVMSPHRLEALKGNADMRHQGHASFREVKGIEDVTHNAFAALTNFIGIPTRTLGTVDEMVKQITYRSKVMAKAHMEAGEQAAQRGLTGDAAKAFMKTYVRNTVDASFDGNGKALDPEAMREALTTTFQNELQPGTLGRSVNNFVAQHPATKVILPFVKTPTNIVRYGWKLTPGLNLAQTEYRAAIKGELGAEQQAQAIGQMALGTLYMTAAAWMASQGQITGGGPKDPRAATQLRSTGWQPYSVVVRGEDGKVTYIPYGRTDPIAIPFGIIADLVDARTVWENEEEPQGFEDLTVALAVALSKQFTSKTYLTGLTDAMEAITSAEGDRVSTYLGRTASNFIPYASTQRQLNPDPYLREARDLTDRFMATIPGLSENLPAKYDAWGEPVYTRKGLWSTTEDQLVDIEVQRILTETGEVIAAPPPQRNGVDLRDLTTADGQNAYEVYQQLASRPNPKVPTLKTSIAKVMQTEVYQRAPDGDAGTTGTKLNIIAPILRAYREPAFKLLLRDPNVREAMQRRQKRVLDEYTKRRLEADEAPEPPATLGNVGPAFGINMAPINAAPAEAQ